jgi:CRISPR-associated protein Cas2
MEVRSRIMLVLITYDVNTETAAGKARLRKVAKQCVNYGRRVQNSVFECILDSAQCVMLKSILSDIIDEERDSLRLYYLGNKYKTKVESIGVEQGIAVDDVLIL